MTHIRTVTAEDIKSDETLMIREPSPKITDPDYRLVIPEELRPLIKTVRIFDENITDVDLSGCDQLALIGYLPKKLKQINIDGCNSVTEVVFSGCDELTSLPNIPPSTTKIRAVACEKLEILSNLPSGLEEISFARSNNLQIIDFSGCRKLKIPPYLPRATTELNFQGCEEITDLNLTRLSELRIIHHLPTRLTKLDLLGCAKIQSLPYLPDSLTEINLAGCNLLIKTPELVARLRELERGGCEVRWPEHFLNENINDEAQRIRALFDKKAAPSTRLLFDRCMLECIDARGGIDQVKKEMQTFIDLIEKNPDHLDWIEKISTDYLQGCVNQPVTGFNRIMAWLSIASDEDLSDKIESSKRILVLNFIKDFIAKLPEGERPGQSVEAEAGNILLIKIHEKLLAEGLIKKPWIGVPKSIAYAGTVQGWIDRTDVDKAFADIKKQFFSKSESHPQVAGFLLDGVENEKLANVEIWTSVAFNEHATVKEAREQFVKDRDELLELLGNDEKIPERFLKQHGNPDRPQPTSAERMDFITNKFKQLELTQNDSIRRVVEEHTRTVPSDSPAHPHTLGKETQTGVTR